jgi:hypothetical protein
MSARSSADVSAGAYVRRGGAGVRGPRKAEVGACRLRWNPARGGGGGRGGAGTVAGEEVAARRSGMSAVAGSERSGGQQAGRQGQHGVAAGEGAAPVDNNAGPAG